MEGKGYVYWQKDGVNISDIFMTITSSGNILIINNITKGNEGEYRCIASNSAGSATSDVANITVSGKYHYGFIIMVLSANALKVLLLLTNRVD